MILIVCPNLAVDQTILVDRFETGGVHRSKATLRAPGAKGVNVARVLSTLKVPCVLTGLVGGAAGSFITAGLQKEQILFQPCAISQESRTCYILADEPNRRQTVVNEPGPEITSEEIARFAGLFEQLLDEAQVAVFSGSLPPGMPDDFYVRLIARTRSAGKRALLDCSGAALQHASLAGPFLLKINQAEAAALGGCPVTTVEAFRAADRLLALGISLVMITLGADGAVLATSKEKLRFVPPAIKARNSVGSGDAALAGLATGLVSEFSLEELGRLAIAAGAANALYGGGQCRLEDVTRFKSQVRCERVAT